MTSINAAVIGLGRMGAFTSQKVIDFAPKCWFPLSHLEALNMIDDVNISAICDQNKTMIEQVINHYGEIDSYSSVDKMLESLRFDLVCVATRTPGRANLINKCIENGVKALHIEKPLCNSIHELQELRELTIKKNIILTYGTLRRYFDVYIKAKKLVDSGKYGKLIQIDINFGHNQLFWSHPHSVDMALFFAGERSFESLQATLSLVEIKNNKDKKTIISDPYIENAILNFSENVSAIISKRQGMDVVLTCDAGKISILADGRLLQSHSFMGEDPYFQNSENHTFQENKPQGTYAALVKTIKKLQSSSESKKNNSISNEHIFQGHKLLFLIVQSHLNNSSKVSMSDLDPSIEILAKTDNFYA